MAEILREEAKGEAILPDAAINQDFFHMINEMIAGIGPAAGFSSDEEDYDDYEDEEVEESDYGGDSLADEVSRYQRRFQRYADMIKQDLLEMGYAPRQGTEGYAKPKMLEAGEEAEVRSPGSRGHKPGCGCPGCTAFMQKLFKDGPETGFVPDMSDMSLPDIRTAHSARAVKTEQQSRKKQDPGSYPCGGKLRGAFRQHNGFMGYALRDVNKDRSLMNYIAA